MGDMKMTIGSRIKAARQAAGLTQADLAAKIGSNHYQIISQYERGTRTPKYETIGKIADALGVPVAKLFGIGGTTISRDDDLEALASIVKTVAADNGFPCPDAKADDIAMLIMYGLLRGKDQAEIDEYLKANYTSLEKMILDEIQTIDMGLLAESIQKLFQENMYFWCDDAYAEELAILLTEALESDKLDVFLKLYVHAPESIREAAMSVLKIGSQDITLKQPRRTNGKKTKTPAPGEAEGGTEGSQSS